MKKIIKGIIARIFVPLKKLWPRKTFILLNYNNDHGLINPYDYVQTIATRNAILSLWPTAQLVEKTYGGSQTAKGIVIDEKLSRYLMLAFPRRLIIPRDPCILLADVHQDLIDFIPNEIKQISVLRKSKPIKIAGMDYSVFSEHGCMNFAEDFLEFLRKNVVMVITDKICIAAPAIAIGIPLILYRSDDSDAQYDIFNGIVPVYSAKDFKNGKVDFAPKSVDIEDFKRLLLKNLEASALSKSKRRLAKIEKKIKNYKICAR